MSGGLPFSIHFPLSCPASFSPDIMLRKRRTEKILGSSKQHKYKLSNPNTWILSKDNEKSPTDLHE